MNYTIKKNTTYVEDFDNDNSKLSRNIYWKRLNQSWDNPDYIRNLIQNSPKLIHLFNKVLGFGWCFRQWDILLIPAKDTDLETPPQGSQQWHMDTHHPSV